MEKLTLKVTSMAHGGSAMGRDEAGRPIFVPFAIPGEKVHVHVTSRKKNFARATLAEVLKASSYREEPRCPHFQVCGGCHFQHMAYDSQLRAKQDVARDQLKRIGGLKKVKVLPTLANPTPWNYRNDASLSPTSEGGLGFWSPGLKQVVPIEICHIIQPQLTTLWQDLDMDLPGLRKLTLRVGDDEALLAALEIEEIEPPELSVDFPISVSIVLPDKTAASLIGDNYLMRTVKGKDFRVSPGCFFQPSSAVSQLLVETVLQYTTLTGTETVVDGYCGTGMLTAFLADGAFEVIGIEMNPDAIADATFNLHERDNVALYQGSIEEILPMLDITPEVMVMNPPSQGLSPDVIKGIAAKMPTKVVYVSSDIATLARDCKDLSRVGYRLVELQPIDMAPQTFHIDSVSLWQKV